MIIGERIRQLRESKHLSQGDIEKRTGLLRCYLSRVENGHTVPALQTIEKLAGALEIPLYRFFYEGTGTIKINEAIGLKSKEASLEGNSKDAKYMERLIPYLAKMTPAGRATFLALAKRMARRSRN